mmetsp:Transcript_32770/g.44929  ORF Transcript_32770/g.44929 Transcript_32770/m.44929 type:complete len:122 (-) Transcript_32770:627-992(-)
MGRETALTSTFEEYGPFLTHRLVQCRDHMSIVTNSFNIKDNNSPSLMSTHRSNALPTNIDDNSLISQQSLPPLCSYKLAHSHTLLYLCFWSANLRYRTARSIAGYHSHHFLETTRSSTVIV